MNIREHIAEIYPLHYQRIVELIYQHAGKRENAERHLNKPTSHFYNILQCAFVWEDTDEGWDYWDSLSQRAN